MSTPAPTPLERFYASFGFEPEGVKRCELAHADGYADSATMARINATTMPAPPRRHSPLPAPRARSAPVKVVIRPATEDDAEGFAQVFADRSAALGTLQHPYTTAELWRTRLTASGRVTGRRCLSRWSTAAWSVMLVYIPSPTIPGCVTCVALALITTRYQGLGIGRMLMNMTLDFAERWANYSRIELTVPLTTPAPSLYESLGFLHEGRHRDFSFREGGYVDALFMARCTSELSATRVINADSGIRLRTHRPGDIGWVISQHGELYSREYGWDIRFESFVARIAADFVDQFDAAHEVCYLACVAKARRRSGSVAPSW